MNTSDPIIKRATYNLPYPKTGLTFLYSDKFNNFENHTQAKDGHVKRFIEEKRLSFSLDNSTFRKIVFQKCNFHDKHGEKLAKIDIITFENCDFNYNIMGSIVYFRVIFKQCKFYRCDFMNAEFQECIFLNCVFSECTSFQARFNHTEIDPEQFLSSILLPEYNYLLSSTKAPILLKREWINVRLFLARQLHKTSNDISHFKYIDSSILLLKKEQAKQLLDVAIYGPEIESTKFQVIYKYFFKRFSAAFNSVIIYLNNILTNGGTSISKLIIIFFVMSIFISIYTLNLDISYNEIPLYAANSSISYFHQIINNLPYGMSLFLCFAYESFETKEHQFTLLAFSIIGLIWYSLILSVLLRRIYK